MASLKWCVVVPSNRPEEIKKFLKAWDPLFGKHDVDLQIIWDNEDTWKQMPSFIPRKTDMVRSWGFYQAWMTNCDYILTLDDDVRPTGDIFEAYEEGFKGSVLSSYLSVGALTDSGLQMRGFPYIDRKPAPVGVQYGGWSGVLDYDAATQLAAPQPERKFSEIVMPVPKGIPTTCCIMNVAFKRELVPIMWQLPMLDGRYNRIGDIWSGLFIKKALDHMGQVMLINGKAQVRHERASNVYNSIVKEAPSIEMNDNIWENLFTPTSSNMTTAYYQVTDSAAAFFKKYDPEYAEYFLTARNEWLDLFDEQL